MTNFSPKLVTQIIDRSRGNVPLSDGQGGFVIPAQWGAANKTRNVTDAVDLAEKFGEPIFDFNHISWSVVEDFLNFGVGSARVVRAVNDDKNSKNAFRAFTGDLNTGASWQNGLTDFRKLNEDDDLFQQDGMTIIKLTGDPSGAGFSVGDTVYKNGAHATVYGTISAIILAAENDSSNAFLFLVDTVGTFAATDTVENAGATVTATVATDGVSETTQYGIGFHEIKLTLAAGDAPFVAVGSVLVQGSASGTVVYKSGNDVYLTDVTGTFTAADIDSIGDSSDNDMIGLVASTVVVSSVTLASDAATVQVIAFYAKYPGSVGNDIDVAFCNKNAFNDGQEYVSGKTFASEFESTAIEEDEIAIIVVRDGEVVETHITSIDTTATLSSGASNFVDEYLEAFSDYIGSESVTSGTVSISDLDDLAAADGFVALSAGGLSGGAAITPTLTVVEAGYDVLFQLDSDSYALGDYHDLDDSSDMTTLLSYVSGKCDAEDGNLQLFHHTIRRELISKASFNINTALTDISGISNYQFIPHYEWKLFNSSWLSKKFFIPCTGQHVALTLQAKVTNDIKAPAGTVRGVLKDVSKLYHNLPEGDGSAVSDLYKYGVNADVFRKDVAGNTLFCAWGNKTKYDPRSDLSRINVVNALMTDVKQLGAIVLPFIFEEISEDTYTSIQTQCDDNYLATRAQKAFDTLDGDGGYVFKCDTGNNTAKNRKLKEIIMDFEVKYKAAAETLKLRISVTSAGTSFQFI